MKPMHLVVAFIVLLGAVWGFLPPFTVTLLSYIGLYALVAVGLVMLTGVGGMTSFGQAAFVGLGAYATAWITLSPEAAQWLAARWPANGRGWRRPRSTRGATWPSQPTFARCCTPRTTRSS